MAELNAPIVRLPVAGPSISPPPPFVERRRRHRRDEDRAAHEEAALLAYALDIVAAEAPAEVRLARVLGLLAERVGARRAAVLSAGPERRVAVAVRAGEDQAAARELATWLDAESPRPRAERAATGRAAITYATDPDPDAVAPAPVPPGPSRDAAIRYALLPTPSPGPVVLGFEMDDPGDVLGIADRLPPDLARHAAVALSVVCGELDRESTLTRLKAREAERERFVATVAHDLRAPLAGLNGYLDLLLGERVDDPAVEREFLERSRRIGESMGELVGDLLEVSRIDSGNLAVEIAPLSVAEVARRAIGALAPLALERGIELGSDLAPRIRTALGDRRLVERILVNLVGNALKFTPPDGHVEVVARVDGPVAVLAVRDDGAGIAQDDRSRIFERFYRMSGHENVTGTGLGLPIARDLARAMGGDLGLASVPGSGSSFVLLLPGTAPVGEAALAEALDEAIAAEEIRLEEGAVLRAIRGPAGGARREHAKDASGPARAAATGGGAASSSPRAAGPPPGPVRLRAIDGALSRIVRPDPA